MSAFVDGQGHSNVLPLPKWTLFVRIAQLVLAFLLLVLTAYSASKLGSGAAGFGLTWFTFIFTVLYFVWLGVSLAAVPAIYHPIAHIPVEILLNIFWLSTWAVLASEATSIGNLEHYLGAYKSRIPSAYRNALNCVKAAAALGALLWVLFCVTLVFLVLAFLKWHKNSVTATAGAPAGAAKVDTEMQNYNNGAAPAGVPPQGAPIDPATGYPVQQQQAAYPPQAQAQVYPQQPPQQAYVDPDQVQQPPYAGGVPPVQQYQEQPVTGAQPPQHPTA
ncbi:uncharacterized protein SPSK_07877 [Sporothrix schenckii 1099-18]|uniref:MARVEL domain-containing protein n=1 Tax=Sporothrix schenckii 1099-18 TaxID=1397361 RepID=A0A0F2ML36_SPOSC|nr:uncharacterized protein SPSK_07877 [Sporothrix schenckii 1099-18]KJR88901.1 hypothetical protein SPSK_07877 [Sporothrix schenckii 1099-18]